MINSFRTDFDSWNRGTTAQYWTPFQLPEGVDDWLNPVPEAYYDTAPSRPYRSHVDGYVQELYRTSKSPTDPDAPPNASAESIVRLALALCDQRNKRLQDDMVMRPLTKDMLEALSLVLLCVPRSTQHILFKSLADEDSTDRKPNFSIAVAGLAIELLADRLKETTIVAKDSAHSLGVSIRHRNQQQNDIPGCTHH